MNMVIGFSAGFVAAIAVYFGLLALGADPWIALVADGLTAVSVSYLVTGWATDRGI